MAPFVIDWREIVERRMAAMRVVPTLDEIEHCHAGLELVFETLPVEQLAFEGSEKALAHRIVEAIAH